MFHQQTVHISMNICTNVGLKTFSMMPLWSASSTKFHSASQTGYPQIWKYNNNNNTITNIPSTANEKTILPQISQFSTHSAAFSSFLNFLFCSLNSSLWARTQGSHSAFSPLYSGWKIAGVGKKNLNKRRKKHEKVGSSLFIKGWVVECWQW